MINGTSLAQVRLLCLLHLWPVLHLWWAVDDIMLSTTSSRAVSPEAMIQSMISTINTDIPEDIPEDMARMTGMVKASTETSILNSITKDNMTRDTILSKKPIPCMTMATITTHRGPHTMGVQLLVETASTGKDHLWTDDIV